MNRGMRVVLLAGCAVFWAGSSFAEEKSSLPAAIQDMEPDIARYVRIVEAFGHGNVDSALELLEAEFPRPIPKASGPFEVDVRAKWQREFGPFSEVKARFESVELVGYQPLSSHARTLVFIGHALQGPIEFRFSAYRYQNKWSIRNLSYQGSWQQIEAGQGFTRFETPIHYSLELLPEHPDEE